MSAPRPAPSDLVLGDTLNREDLVRAVCELGHPVRRSRALVSSVLGAITAHLEAGHDVRLRGFGQFVVRSGAARTGRDFTSGNSLVVTPRSRVVFRPAQALVQRMTANLAGAVPAVEDP